MHCIVVNVPMLKLLINIQVSLTLKKVLVCVKYKWFTLDIYAHICMYLNAYRGSPSLDIKVPPQLFKYN